MVTSGTVDTYLCTACGYCERYVADPAKLATVAAEVAEGVGMTTSAIVSSR